MSGGDFWPIGGEVLVGVGDELGLGLRRRSWGLRCPRYWRPASGGEVGVGCWASGREVAWEGIREEGREGAEKGAVN